MLWAFIFIPVLFGVQLQGSTTFPTFSTTFDIILPTYPSADYVQGCVRNLRGVYNRDNETLTLTWDKSLITNVQYYKVNITNHFRKKTHEETAQTTTVLLFNIEMFVVFTVRVNCIDSDQIIDSPTIWTFKTELFGIFPHLMGVTSRSNSVEVRWFASVNALKEVQFYWLHYTNLSKEYVEISKTETSYLVKGLKPSTNITFTFKTKISSGFGPVQYYEASTLQQDLEPVFNTGLSGGAIAGIVIGILVAVVLVAVIIWFVKRKSSSSKEHSLNENDLDYIDYE